MKDITWSWLAGFIQAEGHITLPVSKCPRYLSIEQAERDPLRRIVAFLDNMDLGHPDIHFRENRGRGTYRMGVYGGPFLRIALETVSLLRGTKMLRAGSWLELSETPVPSMRSINDDWVVGFWEGDGSVYHSGALDIQVVFSQKDVAILKEIRAQLSQYQFGTGTIYDYKYPMSSAARLTYHCGVRNQTLLGWLHENVRCEFRRCQLSIYLEALSKFREESELEEYKNYGKPGYHMPPSIRVLYQTARRRRSGSL